MRTPSHECCAIWMVSEINLATTSEALTEYKPLRRPSSSAPRLVYMCMHMSLELGPSAQRKRIWPQLFGNALVGPLGSAEANNGIWPPPQTERCGASIGGA